MRGVSHDTGRPPRNARDGDLLRAIERERVGALVDRNIDRARELHADDFQLITPEGQSLSKEQYLEAIASGALRYVSWEPGRIEVRLDGDVAVIRYRSEIEVVVDGDRFPRHPLWHTDFYERAEERWRIVWSQATEIL